MQQVEINKREFTLEEEIESTGKYCFFKRITDILCALFGLLVLSPIFLIVGILIKLESKGSVIFS